MTDPAADAVPKDARPDPRLLEFLVPAVIGQAGGEMRAVRCLHDGVHHEAVDDQTLHWSGPEQFSGRDEPLAAHDPVLRRLQKQVIEEGIRP